MADVRDEVITELILEGVAKYLSDWEKVNKKVDEHGEATEGAEKKSESFGKFITDTLSRALSHLLVAAIEEVIQAIGRMIKKFVEFTEESISAAEEFESSITKLFNVMGAGTDIELEDLHQISLKLGADVTLIGISAVDAAEGLEVLYKGGLDTSIILGEDLASALENTEGIMSGAFKSSADLAAISTLEFDDAAGIAIATLATYGKELVTTEEKTQFLDETFEHLVKTANSSNTTVEELTQGYLKAAPTLSALGFSAEETIDSLGLMADAQIKGATAGTQLRRMVANLNRDTKKVTETHEEFGTSLFDNEGSLRSLEDVMGSMNEALYGEGESLVYVSNLTADQTELLGKAEDQYVDATEKLDDYNAGLTTLSDTKLDSLIGEQERALAIMNDLGEAGGEYITVSKEMTDQDRARVIQTLAGVHGQNALNILMSTYTDELGEVESGYERLADKKDDALEITDQVTNLLATTAGQREIVESMLETLQIQYGGIFLGVLKEMLVGVETLLDAMEPELGNSLMEIGSQFTALAEEHLEDVVTMLIDEVVPAILDFVTALPEAIQTVVDFGSSTKDFVEDSAPFVAFLSEVFELITRLFILPVTEGIKVTKLLAETLGLDLPAGLSATGSALEPVTELLEWLNNLLDEGLLVSLFTMNNELGIGQERWEFLKDVWEVHIIPLLEVLIETFWKLVSVNLEVMVIIGDLILIFFNWLDAVIGVREYFDAFIDETIALFIESLEKTGRQGEDSIDMFDRMWASLKKIVDYVNSNWQSGMDKIANGLEPVRSALESMSNFLDGLLGKLREVSGFSGVASGRLPGTDSVANSLGSGAGNSSVNNYYYYTTNSQANTVNATTPATPQQLTSVFTSISLRSV